MPSNTIKFYLDENVPASVADRLRELELDTVRCHSLDPAAETGPDHLTLASEQNRALVTFDHDFLRASAEGRSHAGIVFVTEPKTPSAILAALIDLHATRSSEQFRNRVLFV